MCHVTYTWCAFHRTHTKWETAAFIDILKSVLRCKYRLLVHHANKNRKKINIAKCYVSAMLELILLSYDRVNIGWFYERCGNRQKWLQQCTAFTVTIKASNMAMSVSRSINIHKLRCHMIHNYCYYTILVFLKVLIVLVNNWEFTLCIPKLR